MRGARGLSCPLCGLPGPFEPVMDVRKRRHLVCGRCRLIFIAEELALAPEVEKARYAMHQNGPHDAGYVQFLRQALVPVLPRLNARMRGLDYGCGHTPTLFHLLRESGLHCENYDLFFFPEPPDGVFDYIFCTEVVEHFFEPGKEWKRMVSLVKPGGFLTIMTWPWTDLESFGSWGYASDATHIAFYHRQTMDWISDAHGLEILNRENLRVTLFSKPV